MDKIIILYRPYWSLWNSKLGIAIVHLTVFACDRAFLCLTNILGTF